MTTIAGTVHEGDIGTVIELQVTEDGSPLNVSGATDKQFIFKKPSLEILTVAASATTNGIDGKIQFVTVEGSLDEAGLWQVQAKVVLPSGTWKSSIIYIQVEANLE